MEDLWKGFIGFIISQNDNISLKTFQGMYGRRCYVILLNFEILEFCFLVLGIIYFKCKQIVLISQKNLLTYMIDYIIIPPFIK